jgi:cysteinyl-tRNA synthetase
VHYRTNLKFTKKGLEDAHKARRKIMEWMKEVESAEGAEGAQEWNQKFAEAMDSDLNTPAALAVVFDVMSWSRNEDQLGSCKGIADTIKSTFGCFDPEEAEDIPQEVSDLAQKRLDARSNKDFAASDTLRDQIQELGYEVKDTEKGQEIIKM